MYFTSLFHLSIFTCLFSPAYFHMFILISDVYFHMFMFIFFSTVYFQLSILTCLFSPVNFHMFIFMYIFICLFIFTSLCLPVCFHLFIFTSLFLPVFSPVYFIGAGSGGLGSSLDHEVHRHLKDLRYELSLQQHRLWFVLNPDLETADVWNEDRMSGDE